MQRSSLASACFILISFAISTPASAVDVTTRAFDNNRSGWNGAETTFKNNNLATLHLLRTFNVDEKVEAQPLVYGNALYVFSMNNTVYRFDVNTGALLNSRHLAEAIDPCVQPGQMDMWCVYHKWGIASTPVIDPATNSLYLVTFQRAPGSGDNGNREHHLWTLDATTLANQQPDILIRGNADNGGKHFNVGTETPYQKLRAGLGLLTDAAGNKAVILAFSMNGENPAGPGNGFVFAYDTRGLHHQAGFTNTPGVWCVTPNGGAGGIWMAGSAPAIAGNNIYFTTGNGAIGNSNYGESFVKLAYTAGTAGSNGGKPSLALSDFWTAFDDNGRAFNDEDLGASGVLLVPGFQSLVGGGKDGVLYNLNRTDLGHNNWAPHFNLPFVATYLPNAPNGAAGLPTSTLADANWPIVNLDRNLHDGTPDGKMHHLHGTPVYLRMATHGNVYLWGENERVKVYNYNFTTQRIDAFRNQGTVYSSAGKPPPGGMPGGMLALSSNGTTAGSAVLWATIPKNGDANQAVVQGSFVVFDATTIVGNQELKKLYSYDYNYYSKFAPPVVANGKAYVPTFGNSVLQFGL
ncbi:MAG TPA: hypothetical protein VFQ61_22260 [Polyangiaceae bacterium]|nr:hypothetical protein [Polyangiaceae bacterium]